MKFEKGDKLILIKNKQMAADIGAKCVCDGYYRNGGYQYISIIWDKNDKKCHGQSNGGYLEESFKKAEITNWRKELNGTKQ